MDRITKRAAASLDDYAHGSRADHLSDSNGLGAYHYVARTSRASDASSSSQPKRARVDTAQNSFDNYEHIYESRPVPSVAPPAFLQATLSSAMRPNAPPRLVGSPTTGTQRVPVDTLQPYSAASDGLPAGWGPLDRSSSYSSLLLVSPAASSPDSRRGSTTTESTQAVTSPDISTGSGSQDGTRSHHAVFHSQIPTGYPGSFVNNGTTDTPPAAAIPHATRPALPSSSSFVSFATSSTGNHESASPAAQAAFFDGPDYSNTMSGQTAQPVTYNNAGLQGPAQNNTYPEANNPHTNQVPVGHTTEPQMFGYQAYQQSHAQESEAPGEGVRWSVYYPSAQAPGPSMSASPAAIPNIVNQVDFDPREDLIAQTNSLGNEVQIATDGDETVDGNLGEQAAANGRRPRSSFSQERRKETGQTRTHGACLRCKSQRIRCVPSPDGPRSMCQTCRQVSTGSKKVLHQILCVRWRLNEMSLYRRGGLNITDRWSGSLMRNINDWVDNDIQTIDVKLFYSSKSHNYDLCDLPVRLRVRKFAPNSTDVLTRKWTKTRINPQGIKDVEKLYVKLPPYALADVNEASEALRDYFNTNTLRAVTHVARYSETVIGEHMRAAVQHYDSLPNGDVEKTFLEKFFRLWFYIRFTTGSAYISGTNKLGCAPVTDPDYPLGNRISLPRMITAQCDSIMVTRFLRPLATDVLNEFERFYRVGNPDNWFMLYVCTFILLEEVSFSSLDRRRHAVENWMTNSQYSVSDFVAELQFGANIVLCYWHYYRTMDPTDEGWDIFCQIITPCPLPREKIASAQGRGKKKVHITKDQRCLVTAHWGNMIETAELLKAAPIKNYEHPLYFVCQMYVKGWDIMETYVSTE